MSVKRTGPQWACAAIGVFLLAGAGEAGAHHSATMYDASRAVTLQGTLKKTLLSNPHSWFWLVVPNDQGSGDVWALEAGSIAELSRRWGAHVSDELTIGQKITITIHPLKDGRLSGQVVSIVLENGKVLTEATAGSATDVTPGSSQSPPSPPPR